MSLKLGTTDISGVPTTLINTVNNKLDASTYTSNPRTNAVYITQTYHSGSSWYRVWSDGFIEQGGKVTGAAYNASGVNVTFLKSFSDTNYIVNVTALEGTNYINGAWVNNMSSSQMLVKTGGENSTAHLLQANWYACGY